MQELKNSMASERKLAQAVGGKLVRACDNCVRNRAWWYCAADDAFLCDSCDSAVHSANPLARRHERVRLKIPSSSSSKEKEKPFCSDNDELDAGVPSWQKGFTRKARTPRQKKNRRLGGFPAGVVPEEEICSEEENEEQLLYRVPVFDVERNYIDGEGVNNTWRNEVKAESEEFAPEMKGFGGTLSPELDLDEFAVDVESLLGKRLDDMELGLGIFGQDEEFRFRVKDEDEEIGAAGAAAVAAAAVEEGNLLQFEGFELNFDCYDEEEEDEEENKRRNRENKALLKLDYDQVMSAWDYRKSPWMTGERPEFSSGDWWPDYFPGTGGEMHVAMASGVVAAAADGGREARVSRYREKRRTRLFSKKIRYEVRKLNAEKRPRMKGRFIKRPTFAASPFPLLNK